MRQGGCYGRSAADIEVLLVDDEDEILDSFSQLLEIRGYVVHTAGGAEAALELLERGLRPSVIVCDVRMPGMDGHEFFERVKSMEGVADVPFIFLTCCSGDETVLRASRQGVDRFLVKPVSVNMLDAVLRGLVERMGERRRRVMNELERKKGEFFSWLSHQLRTPLNGIVGFGDLFLECPEHERNELLEETVACMRECGERLRAFSEDLALIASLERRLADGGTSRCVGRLIPLGFLLDGLGRLDGVEVVPPPRSESLEFDGGWIPHVPDGDGLLRRILERMCSFCRILCGGRPPVLEWGFVDAAETGSPPSGVRMVLVLECGGDFLYDLDEPSHVFVPFLGVAMCRRLGDDGASHALVPSLLHSLLRSMGGSVEFRPASEPPSFDMALPLQWCRR